MYFNEHNPPYFHVEYNENRAAIDIKTFVIMKGRLPLKVLGLVVEWAEDHQVDYKISLEFNDNKKGIVDLKDFILNGKIKPFKQLQDIEKFKKFKVDYTLKWDDELDLAPEYLYFKAFKTDNSLTAKFQEWGYIQ